MRADTFYLGPADRRLLLSALEVHAGLAHPGALSQLVGAMVEQPLRRGEVLANESPLEAAALVADGSVQVTRGAERVTATAGQQIGLIPLLARSRQPLTITAEHDSLVLLMPRDTFDQALAGSFALSHCYLRYLAGLLVSDSNPPPTSKGPRSAEKSTVAGPLDLAGRIVALGDALTVGGSGFNAVAELARHVSEVPAGTGDVVWRPADDSGDILFVVGGVLRQRYATGERYHNAGDVVGLAETLAQSPRHTELTVEQAGTMLRVPAGAFLDVLEDHPGLARLILARLAGRIQARQGWLVTD